MMHLEGALSGVSECHLCHREVLVVLRAHTS